MARAPAKAPETKERILPLAAPLLDHHRLTLDRIMEQWSISGRVPPVLLLTGVTGVGKRQMAYFLAQCLLCLRTGFGKTAAPEADPDQDSLFGGPASVPEATEEAPVRISPCGECMQCQRAISGNWVDFSEISASREDGETGTLKIDQFRELKASMGFGAFDGSYRITLIRDADRMTVQAANSLLKLLEEPPPGWILLLTASDASSLLPTLVSRCQMVKLKPLPRPVLERWLRDLGLSEEKVAVCAVSAQGSWGRAEALALDETWDRRSQILQFLEHPAREASALVDWAASEPSHLSLLLDQLEQGLAELVKWSLDPSLPLTHRSLKTHASEALKRYGGTEGARRFWTARADRVFRARQESLAPLNKKLLLQDVLLPFLT